MTLPTDYTPKLGLSFIFRLPLLIPCIYHIDASYPKKLVIRFLVVLSPPAGNRNLYISKGRERIKFIEKESLHQDLESFVWVYLCHTIIVTVILFQITLEQPLGTKLVSSELPHLYSFSVCHWIWVSERNAHYRSKQWEGWRGETKRNQK